MIGSEKPEVKVQQQHCVFKMAEVPTREWSDEQLKSDDLNKKDVIKFIQDNAAHSVCLILVTMQRMSCKRTH